MWNIYWVLRQSRENIKDIKVVMRNRNSKEDRQIQWPKEDIQIQWPKEDRQIQWPKEDRQIQWPNEKGQKNKQWYTKHYTEI